MSSQDIIISSRMIHLRELKSEVSRLKEENAFLKNELESLKAHFDLALLAQRDLENLSPHGRMIIIDGWNMILGANRCASDRGELIRQAELHVQERPQDFVWLVFDGHDASSKECGRVRVSYTGGKGLHRADKLVCDYLRMARWLGKAQNVEVRTSDKDFLKQVEKIRK